VTTVNDAQGLARRAAHSRWLERLTRFGLVGYGVTHLIVGWIALQLAFGKAPTDSDQSGAFRTLAAQPVGRFLLLAVAVGLLAMVVWQVLAAAQGHRDERGKARTFERIASGFRAVFYAVLAFKAIQIVAGSGKSQGDQQQQTTSHALSTPGGRWLVAVVGIAVVAVGLGLAAYGLTRRFERKLKQGQMTPAVRRSARWLGMVGYAAKGAAYAVVGVLVLLAAVRFDPAKSRGLDAALRTLARQPAGDVLLIGVALGIAAFGVYCLYQAKYRKV
jgi:hypothetical protein